LALLIFTADYTYMIFSVQELPSLLNLLREIKRRFSIECFYIRLCDLKTEVFYSHLWHYRTTQTVRPDCSNFWILHDCIVLNGIKNIITSH